MRINSRAIWTVLAVMAWPWLAHAQLADPEFTVGDIRIEGLQRISQGTVFNYLPVNIGDRLTAQRLRESIRSLYATGFFRDVELRRDGNTLVVAVLERPSLESVEIKGNKDIKTEDLQKSLRQMGLSAGKTFNPSTLDELTQALTDQYYSRGKYAVVVDPKVEDLPNNRVRVTLDVKEGARARIRNINVVGNNAFTQKQIRDGLTLRTPNWMSWYRQSDRYSRESLQGDLEKVQQFYQDRGYANFRVDSVQVAIAPDKTDIFVTVNVTEGVVYKLGEIKLAGNMVVPEGQLRRLVLVQPGQIYSQQAITATQELIKNRLGAEGYYFARVEPVPTVDEEKKIVTLTMFIEPGNRVYVREIKFTGSTRSNDETLRREMRQLEGALLSNVALERSRQRLRQQPFIEEAEFETEAVSGTPDLVDITFTVTERPSATVGGGVGYSASQGFLLNGSFNDSNFVGSGNNVALQLDSGQYNKIASFSHTNPYRTVDGLARTVSLSYRDSKQFVSNSSDFKSTNMSLGLNYGYPVTEFQRVNMGLIVQRVDFLTYAESSAQQAVDWVRNNGNPYVLDAISTVTYPDGTTVSASTLAVGTKYTAVDLTAGWLFDSRNRALFADRGQRHSMNVSYTLPGTARNWMASYEYAGYLPLWGRWTMAFGTQLAYGDGVGDTTSLSPYKRLYAGGPDTVRGFSESSLGPRDNFGNPYGGNLLTVARSEVILPLPVRWQSSARISLFYDIGGVFSTDDVQYVGRDLVTPVDYEFRTADLRRSAGIAMQWLAPALGLFRFSYAVPLNDTPAQRGNPRFGDSTEGFQFTVGQSF